MKVLENLKLENIKSTKDHIKYENYWVGRALEVFQYFLLKKFLFLEKKGWFKGKNSKEFSCRKILNSRAENVIALPKTRRP